MAGKILYRKGHQTVLDMLQDAGAQRPSRPKFSMDGVHVFGSNIRKLDAHLVSKLWVLGAHPESTGSNGTGPPFPCSD